MTPSIRIATALTFLAPTAGFGSARTLTAETVAIGLSGPTDLASPALDSRLFVVERTGLVRVIEDGSLHPPGNNFSESEILSFQ